MKRELPSHLGDPVIISKQVLQDGCGRFLGVSHSHVGHLGLALRIVVILLVGHLVVQLGNVGAAVTHIKVLKIIIIFNEIKLES